MGWLAAFGIPLLEMGVVLAADDGVSSTGRLSAPVATLETWALHRNLHSLAREGILVGHQDTLARDI